MQDCIYGYKKQPQNRGFNFLESSCSKVENVRGPIEFRNGVGIKIAVTKLINFISAITWILNKTFPLQNLIIVLIITRKF